MKKIFNKKSSKKFLSRIMLSKEIFNVFYHSESSNEEKITTQNQTTFEKY